MSAIHQQARRTRHVEGFHVARDENGHMGFTRLHPLGHLHTRAAIARVLRHAAEARKLTGPWRKYDHDCFIDRVRQLRKRGTWL